MNYTACLTNEPRSLCPENTALSRSFFKMFFGNNNLCRDDALTPECKIIYEYQDLLDTLELTGIVTASGVTLGFLYFLYNCS